jgi:serine/threonine-protein kinase
MVHSRCVFVPTTFGKYFLTEHLATGGMAEIYRGKLLGPGGFEKQLVIKQILPRLSGQRQFVDLFVAEAKTLVGLAHGNIVPIYELGVIEDTYFLAMEYIDGPTLYRLTELMARRDVLMEPAIAALIIARILEGLDYAHRKGEGVIHRDLSPRNVMLSRDGEVKLVDFGIAVTLGTNEDGERAADGAPTGSFPYMSPEQVRRERLTPQSDLFSVGVLFWEMLVGQRLFARADAEATLAAVTGAKVERPSDVRAEVPVRLDDIVMRALARDPAERWTSAGEMLAQIQRYLYALDETPGPRDVAQLVGRYCPPETRRLPTHSEVHDEPGPDEPAPGGPRTAVIPRDAEAAGKRPRARTETFATNVQLEKIFDPTKPPTLETKVQAEPPPEAPARRPTLLVAAAIGTLAFGVVAVVMVMRGGDRITTPPDAEPDALVAIAVADAPGLDAPIVLDASDARDAPAADAVVIIDAPDIEVPRPRPDAASAKPRPDAAEATPTGTATLRIGADPWGEILVDGKPRGRTPAVIAIPAGKHTVEVVYGGEDPPKTKTFHVDLTDGQTRELQADFTGP